MYSAPLLSWFSSSFSFCSHLCFKFIIQLTLSRLTIYNDLNCYLSGLFFTWSLFRLCEAAARILLGVCVVSMCFMVAHFLIPAFQTKDKSVKLLPWVLSSQDLIGCGKVNINAALILYSRLTKYNSLSFDRMLCSYCLWMGDSWNYCYQIWKKHWIFLSV